MKEKILLFVVGVLVGAIIATGGFLIYSKSKTNETNPQMNQGGEMGEPPEMPNGSEPPAKPDGDNGSMSMEKPNEAGN